MSNMIKVFDLSNASDVSLTSTGFKKGDDTAKYVCKITDATIVFVGDNSKFNTDKKKQFNTICSKEFLMRRREIVDRTVGRPLVAREEAELPPTVNTMVRSSSK